MITCKFSHRVKVSLIFLFLFVVYNANLRSISSGDAEPAKLLPLSILQHGNLYLDDFASVYIGNRWGRNPYFIRFIKDHWLSAYPVVIPIIIFPIYIPLKFIIYYYHIPYNHPLVLLLNDIMEKISASAIASISVVVLYLVLCQFSRRSVALGLSLVYGLAANTWSTSAQALWQHGMSQLLLCLTLWLLLRADSRSPLLVRGGLTVHLLM